MKKEKIAEFKEAYKDAYKQAMYHKKFKAAVKAVDSLVHLEEEHDPNGIYDITNAPALCLP